MAGIYLHIPFCRQACSYCNFHFTTSLRRKNELLAALLSETDLRKDYLEGEAIKTIYFGGGTPSLLAAADIKLQIEKISSVFPVENGAEITIETNPDDITEENLLEWKLAGINRLSIGIQSFFDEDLLWMNRAHTAEQAINSLDLAINHFNNITVDLIYGTPLLTNEKWRANIEQVLSRGIPHLSCYALTVEEKTPLHKLIANKQVTDVDPGRQSEQFLLLMQWMEEAGYEHYEISNFAKPGSRSRHNSSYWQGEKYLGLGPAAHSFDGTSRQWNISNNNIYIDSLNKGSVPFEKEILSPVQKLNEYIMTSLRTIEGLDLRRLEAGGDSGHRDELILNSRKFVQRGLVIEEEDHLKLTNEGKLFADAISAELFFEEVKL